MFLSFSRTDWVHVEIDMVEGEIAFLVLLQRLQGLSCHSAGILHSAPHKI